MTTLTIFCSSKLTVNKDFYEPCEELITLLNNDFKYAYGGGSDGLMGRVNRVCIENGYYTTGVNCNRWKDEGDKLLNEVVYFDSITDRQNELIRRGDGYIVLPGGVGTLYEALQCITLNDVRETNKPVFFLNVNKYFNSLFNMLDDGRIMGTIMKTNREMNIIIRDTPGELATEIKNYFKSN
jgi:uncharacterized protein (TIGR00730 family)